MQVLSEADRLLTAVEYDAPVESLGPRFTQRTQFLEGRAAAGSLPADPQSFQSGELPGPYRLSVVCGSPDEREISE